MLGVNQDYLSGSNASKFFGFELNYDKDGFAATASKQYNGNIGAMAWRTRGDGVQRKYDFTYDNVNRLLRGDFTQLESSNWTNATVNYDVKMGDGINATSAYDANGNILRMQQWGWKLSGSDRIDDLRYHYYHNGTSNRLLNVIDDRNDAQTKLGDFRTSVLHPVQTKMATTVDYTYDANGNMVKDLNKDVTTYTNADGIIYNHLNLPQTITVKKDGTSNKGTITYVYDAAGSKLAKIVTEANQPTKTTAYIAGMIYENDVLQLIGHEEGRIRPVRDAQQAITGWVYDYMLKDHLGNVRMVLTEEQQQDIYPAATLEGTNTSGARQTEKNYYTINYNAVVDKTSVAGLTNYANNNGIANPNPGGNSSVNSAKLYKLNGNGTKTGLGITLKVMAGDKINIFGKSYYKDMNTGQQNYPVPVMDILNGLLGTPTGATAGKSASATLLYNNTNGVTVPLQSLLNTQAAQNSGTPTKPRAYINYVFFDEQMQYAGGGFSQVGSAWSVKDHYGDASMQNISVPKNGYVYVYCSNESGTDVFFDNLQVVHDRGRILEETHYYPFGLVMAGISGKAAGKFEGKYKFNSIEFNDDFDIDLYDAQYRTLGPQIGRFWQIDPKPDGMISPYAMMGNNPIKYSDPLGDTLALFRPDGSFWKFQDDGKKEFSGMYYQTSTVTSTFEKDGVQYEVRTYSDGQAFQFNDPAVDVLAIKNGVESLGKVGITGIEVLTDAKADKQIDRSGVKSSEAQKSPMSYAKNQGAKKMDYGVQGIINGDLNPKKFYLREGVAYNVGDIGNYLWGRGMAYLGIDLLTAKIGAHWNNIFHGSEQKTKYYDFGPGTYGSPGFWDSPGDQRAIRRGYNNSPPAIEAARKEMMLLESEIKYGPKF